jgi:hypothetical protein
MSQYPILQPWGRQGDRIALIFAVVIVLAGLWGAVRTESLIWLAATVPSAGLCYLLIPGYAELMRLVIDMLLPT